MNGCDFKCVAAVAGAAVGFGITVAVVGTAAVVLSAVMADFNKFIWRSLKNERRSVYIKCRPFAKLISAIRLIKPNKYTLIWIIIYKLK